MAYTRGGGYVFLTRSGERERACRPSCDLEIIAMAADDAMTQTMVSINA